MKPWERKLALVGGALLAVSAYGIRAAHGPARDVVLPGSCHTPVLVLDPAAAEPRGAAIVFHGLSANRRMMQTVGQWLAAAGFRVYLVEFPGHGDSVTPFAFSRAETCATELVDHLSRIRAIRPDRTILVGHSMGGAIAIRLADRLPTVATIAISPAPMLDRGTVPADLVLFAPSRRMPANLLVFYGGWEATGVGESARGLLRAAGGERTGPEDFRQRRAAKLIRVAAAMHTSLLFDPRVRKAVLRWTASALDLPQAAPSLPGYPVAGSLLGVAGLVMLFPAAASGLAGLFGVGASAGPAATPKARDVLLRGSIAGLFAVALLAVWVPPRALRIYTGDYLASFFLITGIVLLALLGKEALSGFRWDRSAVVAGSALGLASILAFGAWLTWQLADAWMIAARWLRFVPAALVCIPYFVAEEAALGPPARERRWPRFAEFVLLRVLLWLALIFGLFVLRSGQVLVLLLGLYLGALAIFQRLGADALRRRTGSAAGAAIFSAILTAWFLAAVLPLT